MAIYSFEMIFHPVLVPHGTFRLVCVLKFGNSFPTRLAPLILQKRIGHIYFLSIVSNPSSEDFAHQFIRFFHS